MGCRATPRITFLPCATSVQDFLDNVISIVLTLSICRRVYVSLCHLCSSVYLLSQLYPSYHSRVGHRFDARTFDMSVYSAPTAECTVDGFSSPTGTSFETDESSHDLNDIIAPRWWEEKALQTLATTTNLYEIRLICRHIPFADHELPSIILSRHWTHIHDTHLTILEAEHYPISDHCIESAGLSPVGKAGQLVRLLMADKSDSAEIQAIFWCPPTPYSNKSPRLIAQEWISEFDSILAEVSWEDWMSMALGHKTTAICSLLEHSRKTRNCLRRCMNGLQSSENKYYLVDSVSLVSLFDECLV